MNNSENKKGSAGNIVKLIAVAVIAAGIVLLFIFTDVTAMVTNLLSWIQSTGIWAPIIFFLVYILAAVLFLPGSILTLGAGFFFGVVKGTILVSVSSTAASAVAFIVGRYLFRESVNGWIKGKPRFEAVNEAIAREGWKIVGLLRLSPLLPYNLSNYFYGITKVKFRGYILASWIGMFPGTVMYVYFGKAAADLASLSGSERTTLEWALFGIGLAATIAVVIIITRVAAKILNQKLSEQMLKKWKTVLVTGGSSGIGMALVRKLVNHRDLVLAAGSRKYEECGADFPLKRNQYLSIDLSKDNAPHKLADWAREQAEDNIELIIHDAGIGYTGPIASQGAESAARMYSVNLRIPVLLTREILGYQNKSRKCTIVFVSSVVSNLPSPAFACYTATKAAIDAFVRNLAAEQPEGYRVIAVHPGATNTAMHRRSALDDRFMPKSTKGFASPDAVAGAILGKIEHAVKKDSHIRLAPLGFGNSALMTFTRIFPRLFSIIRRNPGVLGGTESSGLYNKTGPESVLITGAASGIGLALTRKYLQYGSTVYALDRDLAGLEELGKLNKDQSLFTLKCDLSDRQQIHEIVKSIPPIDIVIHNAGISVFGRFENQKTSSQDTVLKVNGLAPLLLEQELMQQNKADSHTKRAFMSSLSAFVGYPGAAVYAATKDLVKSYGESLAAAMPGKVTVVYPGPTKTPHARRYSPDNSRESSRMEPEILAEYIFSAVEKGKPRLIPGAGLRAFAFAGRIFPQVTESSLRKSMLDPIEGRVLE
ncbi:MAG: SDR family NAD(P)-dependent oxidoreductase [Spirochaetales bacterium]|uniref:SDR family NAD(P)-dependent oxidoreductase n=1 Tax=Candidatus Thalassospirochaeta sargassi TaxID=3119039 RepID=A0AAJ1MI77_9SPIO|nr:SDR family NAD(P)-dependent oxidoreductase [Spirochaetales bacterium]